MSTYVFACLMGLCWLATVPLTNALLSSTYGVTHLSLVSGLAFLFHQVGADHQLPRLGVVIAGSGS